MGEGGGFLRVWAMVNLVSLGLPVACPNTKGAPKCELTNLLVGLMQVRACPLLGPFPELQHAPLPLLMLKARSMPQVPNNFAI